MKKISFAIAVSIVSFACSSQRPATSQSTDQLQYSIEDAPEWSALFHRYHGWFGGDGIFAISLNGKENAGPVDTTENMILFSDSMLGDIVDGKPKDQNMVNNTVAILRGGIPDSSRIKFYWNEAGRKPAALFIPNTPSSEKGDYYWLGDGFRNDKIDGAIYIFAYRMHNENIHDDWSFRQRSLNLIKIPKGSKPPFREQQQMETPFLFKGESAKDDGSFGSGVYVNTKSAGAINPDGFVYIYGIKGEEKSLVAARVKPELIEKFSEWRFWDGENWNKDVDRVAAIVPHVSNELSVTALKDGRYLLIFQEGGMSHTVAMRIGSSPVGPFGPSIRIYESEDTKENKNYFGYNAKAHPTLSTAGELLVSYNVNSFDFWNEIQKNPTLYRPRFFKIVFK